MKFLLSILLISQATQAAIPEIKKPAKHIIGFACLKEVQGPECYTPFEKYDKDGNILPQKTPTPTWAPKLTTETPSVMTGYGTHGYKVLSIEKDRVNIQGKSESFWIPKDKVSHFTPLEEAPFCKFGDKDWAKKLYLADLKTFALVKSKHPFISMEVLEKKWVAGQLWLKVDAKDGEVCTDGEPPKSLGQFWTPYSETIALCPMGC